MINKQRDDNWLTLDNDLPSATTKPRGWTMLNGRLIVCDNTGDELWELALDPDDDDKDRSCYVPLGDEPMTEAVIGLWVVGASWAVTLLGFWLAGWLT